MKRKPQKLDAPNEQGEFLFDPYAFHDFVGMGLHFVVIPGEVLPCTFEVYNLVLIQQLTLHADGKISFKYSNQGNDMQIDLSLNQSAAFAARIMEIKVLIFSLTGKALPA